MNRVTATYDQIVLQGAPRMDRVDALAYKSGTNLERLTYWRLVIPQKLGTGDALVLSLSVSDPTINLRSEAA